MTEGAPRQSSEDRLRTACTPLPGSVPGEVRRPLRVRAEDGGTKAFELALKRNPQVGATEWRRRFDVGLMRLEDQVLRGDEVLQPGQRMDTVWPDHVEPAVSTEIGVVYEDEALLILNKPAPLPVHPSGRFTRNTLSHILSLAFPELPVRMAHRLDADTTGILVCTKSKEDAARVQPQFEERQVEKDYLLQVHGMPSWQQVSCIAPVSRKKLARGRRQSQETESGRNARTTFEVVKVLAYQSTLLRARLLTGRTNQIRIHAALLGLPILGDHGYGQGAPEQGGLVSPVQPESSGLRLHAEGVTFAHPRTGKRVSFRCAPPWPGDELRSSLQ